METPTEIKTGEKLYLLSSLVKEEKDFDTLVAHLKKHPVEIKKQENLGERELVFPINKEKKLLLTSIFFTAEPANIKLLEQELRHEEHVQRFLLTDWKGDLEAPVKKSHAARLSEKKEKTNV